VLYVEDFVRDLDAPCLGKIRIRGIVGDSLEADLIKLNIKPAPYTNSTDVNCVEYSHNIAPFIPVAFAVCDKMIDGYDIILTADVVEQLNQLSDYDVSIQLAVALPTGVGVGNHSVDSDAVDSPAGCGGGELGH